MAPLYSCGTFSSCHMDWKSWANLCIKAGPLDLHTSAGMASGPGALPQESCLIAFLTSSSAVRLSSSQFGYTWGRRAMAFTFAEAGWLRALLKCSAHLSKICSCQHLSPTALRRGEDPADSGPYTAFRSLWKCLESWLSA